MLISKKALYPYYHFKKPSVWQRLVFGTTYRLNLYRISKERRQWDQIANQLWLGMIPAQKDLPRIQQDMKIHGQTLGLVVSVVDIFELAGKGPVRTLIATPSDWDAQGIQHYWLPMTDFKENASDEIFIQAAFLIHEYIQQGKSVYVHCKAGRTRSAMLCAIYLSLFATKNKDLSTVIFEMKTKRPQLSLPTKKILKIQEVINTWQAHSDSEKILEPSPSTKNKIAQLTAFKMLAIYMAQHESSLDTKTLQTFFHALYESENNTWPSFPTLQNPVAQQLLLKFKEEKGK